MGTTDKDALVASQIAYMRIEKKHISGAIEHYGSATLENIFKEEPKIKEQYIERVYNGRDPETTELSEYEQMRLEEAGLNRRGYPFLPPAGLCFMIIIMMMLGGCGMLTREMRIKKAIVNHLEEAYGEEFTVLSMRQPKLLPSDNGAIYATCLAENDPGHPFEGSYFYPRNEKLGLEVINDGYAEYLLAKQMEEKVEQAVSQVAESYYIKVRLSLPEEWRDIPVEEISRWENYVALCNQSEPDTKSLGAVDVYLDASTMKGKTDEEEYRLYERVYREMGGKALLYIHYLEKENFQQAKEYLETSTQEGYELSEARKGQPYFGTIMRYGKRVFDDSLEVFKAAKQGEEQEIFK